MISVFSGDMLSSILWRRLIKFDPTDKTRMSQPAALTIGQQIHHI
jgi:hypothetical protein